MSESTILTPVTDRSQFSMHPEDWVTQADSHDEQSSYFKQALRRLLPDCFVARDLAVYWVPGQYQHPYVGPDIFVARRQPRVEDPTAWLVFEDGPLELVIEVASEATRGKELDKRDQTYAVALQVPEYVYVDLQRDALELGTLGADGYEPVPPDAEGRLWSRQLPVGFVRPPGERLVRVIDAEGEIVSTAREEVALRREAEERAERESRRAEQESRRAEQESRRAEALAAELEQLRRGLGQEPDAGTAE
jgi:Uma2 family endonuclease